MDPSRNCIVGSWLWLAPIPWSLYPRYGLQGLDQQTRETTNGALNHVHIILQLHPTLPLPLKTIFYIITDFWGFFNTLLTGPKI